MLMKIDCFQFYSFNTNENKSIKGDVLCARSWTSRILSWNQCSSQSYRRNSNLDTTKIDCKSISTPKTIPCKLSINYRPMSIEEQIVQLLPCRQTICSTRYLVSCTHPHVSYCASFLSKFMQNYGI